MSPGCLRVPLAPFDKPIQGFVEQLPRHDHHHDFAQGWYEHRHQVDRKQPDVQVVRIAQRAIICISQRSRDRHALCIGKGLGAHLFEQGAPQINVCPDAFAAHVGGVNMDRGMLCQNTAFMGFRVWRYNEYQRSLRR